MKLVAGGLTDVGRVRQNNEDKLLIASDLWAVADGMGGHAAGEVASEIAVQTLAARFAADRTADGLADAVREANREVWERAQADADRRGMGTTLTAAALVDDGDSRVLAIVNVGDSRAYRLHDREFEQLTEDHSVVEELVRTGRLAPEEAHLHPHRHILTRVLGVDPDVEVDCFRVLPYRGDRFVLASDGLTNEVDDDDIASVLRTHPDPDESARALVDMAKRNGGNDNITIVVIDVVDDDDRSAKASAALADEKPRHDLTAAVPVDSEAAPAPPAPPAPARPASRATTPRPPRTKRFTWRVGAFIAVIVALLAITVAAVAWFGRSTYHVTFDGDQVVIKQGPADGLLWFDPTIKERTTLTRDEVPSSRVDDLEAGKEASSLEDARAYVERLREQHAATTTTTTTATAATSAPPAPNTTPAP